MPVANPLRTLLRKPLSRYAGICVTYLIPVILVLGPVLRHPMTLYVGTNEDAGQFMWYLGWTWHALTTGQNPFVTNLLNYPLGLNLMTNTSVVAESLVFGPLVYLLNSVFAYNTVVVAAMLLSGIFGFSLTRKLQVRPWVALFSGLLLEVCPFVINQFVDGHVNLALSLAIILSVLCVTVTFIQEGTRHPVWFGALCGTLLAVQFYTSLEFFATFFLIAAITVLVMAVVDWQRFTGVMSRHGLLSFYIAACCSMVVLVSPGVWMFLFGFRQTGITQGLMPHDVWVTDLANLWLPTQAQLLHTTATNRITRLFTGNLSEQDGYLGVPMLVSLIWCIWQLRSRRWAWGLLLVGLIAVVLSMGPELHVIGHRTYFRLPWDVIQRLPLLKDATAGRLMLYADIAFVIVMALGIEQYLQKRKSMISLVTGVLLLGAIGITWLPNAHFWHQEVPASARLLKPNGPFGATINGQPTSVILHDYWKFGYVMQAFADGGYRIPVTNVYGFPYTSQAVVGNEHKHYPNLFLFEDNFTGLSTNQAEKILLQYLHARRPSYFVWLKGYGSPIPASLRSSLQRVCGMPVDEHGSLLWRVPSALTHG